MSCDLGLFLKCPSPEMVEAIGISNLDFVVIDMEHTPLGPKDLYPLVLASERRNLKSIVRIPQKVDSYFKWCRDLNVSAIQVPHVETKEDALYAIKHSYFSPIGERGLCRFVRAADFSGIEKSQYLTQANETANLILQIEGINAVKNLNDILSVINPNISIFIGPYDLSQSLGIPGQIWDDRVVDKMKEIVSRCQEQNIRVGTFTDTVEGIEFWSSRGISFIEYASDLNVFINSANQLKTHLKI